MKRLIALGIAFLLLLVAPCALAVEKTYTLIVNETWKINIPIGLAVQDGVTSEWLLEDNRTEDAAIIAQKDGDVFDIKLYSPDHTFGIEIVVSEGWEKWGDLSEASISDVKAYRDMQEKEVADGPLENGTILEDGRMDMEYLSFDRPWLETEVKAIYPDGHVQKEGFYETIIHGHRVRVLLVATSEEVFFDQKSTARRIAESICYLPGEETCVVVANEVLEFLAPAGFVITDSISEKWYVEERANGYYPITFQKENNEFCAFLYSPIDEPAFEVGFQEGYDHIEDFSKDNIEYVETLRKDIEAWYYNAEKNENPYEDFQVEIQILSNERPWIITKKSRTATDDDTFGNYVVTYETIVDGNRIIIYMFADVEQTYEQFKQQLEQLVNSVRYLPVDGPSVNMVPESDEKNVGTSVGIIGGADGPTSIIVGETAVNTDKKEQLDTLIWGLSILFVIILAILVISIVRSRRKKEKEGEPAETAEQQNMCEAYYEEEPTAQVSAENVSFVSPGEAEEDEYAYLKKLPPSLKKLDGVKGWLLFFKVVLWIGIVAAAIVCLIMLIMLLAFPYLRSGRELALIVLLPILFDLAVLIVILVLFNKRNKAFRWVYIGMIALQLVLGIVNGNPLSGIGIGNIIWTIYLFMSKRVKVTFNIPFDEKELERYWLEEPNLPETNQESAKESGQDAEDSNT